MNTQDGFDDPLCSEKMIAALEMAIEQRDQLLRSCKVWLIRVKVICENLRQQRDAAVKEAGRRDDKWMQGLREVLGQDLIFDDPSARNCASLALQRWSEIKIALIRDLTEANKVQEARIKSLENQLLSFCEASEERTRILTTIKEELHNLELKCQHTKPVSPST